MKAFLSACAVAALTALPAVAGGPTPSNPDAVEYIISPADGATVSGPVTVLFGLKGMGVAPAGTEKDMTGHHHLLLDRAPFGEGPDGAAETSDVIAADDHNIHFGGGQTETTLDLEPGQHTLQLLLGDLNHVPHSDPVVSDVITITVE